MQLYNEGNFPINLAELGKALGAEYRRFRIETLKARLKRQKKNRENTAETLFHLRNARVEQLKWEATLDG